MEGNIVRKGFRWVSGVLLQGLYWSHLAVCSFQKEHYLVQEWSHSHSDLVDLGRPSPPFPLLDRDLQKETHMQVTHMPTLYIDIIHYKL